MRDQGIILFCLWLIVSMTVFSIEIQVAGNPPTIHGDNDKPTEFNNSFVSGKSEIYARSKRLSSLSDRFGRIADPHGNLPPELSKQGGGMARRSDLEPFEPSGCDRKFTNTSGWTFIGPDGGDVKDVSASPADKNIVLAGIYPTEHGSGGTLYRSTDGGAAWSEVTVLSLISVFDIEYDPQGIAYIGTREGMWKSTDSGLSWTQISIAGEIGIVGEVAIDPNDDDAIWASMYTEVYRSPDGGETWFEVTPPLGTNMSCSGIAFHPSESGKVYACFHEWAGGGSFWVSSNNGDTWVDRSSGLPYRPLEDTVHDGERILVTGGELFGSQNFGLFESTNDGITWNALHDASWPVLALTDIDLDPNNVDIIYLASLGAGVYRSLDGGITWEFEAGGTDNMSLRAIHVVPGNSLSILLGADSFGVWRSEDGGNSFVPSSDGIHSLDVYSIAVNPNNSDELAVSYKSQNSGGVSTSLDGGQTWYREVVPATRWNDVMFHPDGTLYALSDGPTIIADEGLYRRNTDKTWTCLGPDQGPYYESDLTAICFSRNDSRLFLLGGNDTGVAGSESTIWTSADAGTSWIKSHEGTVNHETVSDLELVEEGTETIGVASYFNVSAPYGGALRSSDGGFNWEESSTGLDPYVLGFALEPSPTESNTLFFADGSLMGGGLFKTTDAGQTWASTGYAGDLYMGDVVCDPRSGQVLFIMQSTVEGVMVQKSTDGGATFSPFIEGFEFTSWGNDLACAAGAFPRLLLSTTAGVFEYRNMSLSPCLVTGPGPGNNNRPSVRLFPPEQDADHVYEFPAYGATRYGVNVTCGEVTGDAMDEIITGAGPGVIFGPHVRGFQADGTPLPGLSFLAYGTNKYGVNVTAGNIDDDNYDEIITGAGPGAVFGPHVRGWNYDGTGSVTTMSDVNYLAYGTNKWGVNVSAGDIDGDGFNEIITGAGPGAIYGPHVRGWDYDNSGITAIPALNFLAYGTNKFGVNVTCGDVDGDGIDEIVTGPGPGMVFGAHVRGWNYDGNELVSLSGLNFLAWNEFKFGANVFAGADLNGDSRDDLLVGCGPDPGTGTEVKVFEYHGSEVTLWFSLDAFGDLNLTHGTNVAAGRF